MLLQVASLSREGPHTFWRVLGMQTDEEGYLSLDVPASEIPGRWVAVASASSELGERGAGRAEFETSAPFVAQANLPASLTVGDELDLPVVIHNALPVSQTVAVTATRDSWFRVRTRETPVQQVEVGPRQVGVLHLPIQIVERGMHSLGIIASSDHGRYSVSLPADVSPDGLRVVRAYTGRVEKGDEDGPDASLKIRIPWGAMRGTDRVTVKLYPALESVVVEGLGAVLALDRTADLGMDRLVGRARATVLRQAYLSDRGQITPHEAAEAERSIALDYQHILAFETEDGGFSAFGSLPADVYWTAQGLMTLGDMASLYPIDPDVTGRIALWLLRNQAADGTWGPEQLPESWHSLPRAELPLTAHAVWALVESGHADSPQAIAGIEHLVRYQDKVQDPYVLALVVNALAVSAERGVEPASQARDAALVRLAEMAQHEEGRAYWRTSVETLTGAVGGSGRSKGAWLSSGDVETTALATYALVRAGTHAELAALGLATLTEERDANSVWGSPQATYLALKALLAAVQEGYALPSASGVSVTVDEVTLESQMREATGPDEAHVLVFDELSKGYNDVDFNVAEGEATYQILAVYDLPWGQVEPADHEKEPIAIEVEYSRTSVEVGETITATVTVTSSHARAVRQAVVELGLPPGLQADTGALDSMIEGERITHYEQVGEQVVIHLTDLEPEQPVRLSYLLRAEYPLSVKTRTTRAYDVANPRYPAVVQPTRIEVLWHEEEDE
jgi:hypothetical protein